jgi:hypothetical protein
MLWWRHHRDLVTGGVAIGMYLPKPLGLGALGNGGAPFRVRAFRPRYCAERLGLDGEVLNRTPLEQVSAQRFHQVPELGAAIQAVSASPLITELESADPLASAELRGVETKRRLVEQLGGDTLNTSTSA